MKPLSCPSQFIWGQQRVVKNNFQEKELSHRCSTLVLVRLFVAAAATIYQEPHRWRTEGQELLHLCVTPKKIFTFKSIAGHDLANLTQEIQFLEFMCGSTLTHTH